MSSGLSNPNLKPATSNGVGNGNGTSTVHSSVHSAAHGADGRSASASSALPLDPSAVFQALSSNPRLLAAASVLVERSRLANKWGMSFGNARNLQTALGYYKDSELTTAVYRSFYERGDIAERIIEAYPLATWGDGLDIIEDPDPGLETPFESAIVELVDRLDLWSVIIRADIMAGLGANGYSGILIGAVGNSETELVKYISPNPDSILYLKPLYDDECKIYKYDTENNSPRFGLPEIYEVELGMPDGKAVVGYQSKRKVHWTRIVHVVEGNLGNSVFGKPRLRAIINRLHDKEKLVGGGSEAAWNKMDPGQHWAIDPEYAASITPADEAALLETFDEVTHGLKRKFKTVGVDIKDQITSVVNFNTNLDSVIKLISATTGIPKRILEGSEAGELASSQDQNNWNVRVGNRRTKFAIPLVRLIIDRFIEYGALPRPQQYEGIWPEIDELDEKSKAEVEQLRAEANKAQFEAGGGLISTSNEIRLEVRGKGPIEDAEGANEGSNMTSDDDSDNVDNELQAAIRANTDDSNSGADNSSRRVVIVGGPRRGKSTVARQLRELNIPTYCGDPKSKVKDPEDNVTYLPEGLDWSASSQYIADSWLTQPGPWCVEGIATVRALRKLVADSDYFNVDIAGIEVIVLANAHPDADNVTDKQESTSRAVMTMWSEIEHHFPQAKVLKRKNARAVVACVDKDRDINANVPRKLRHSKGVNGSQRFMVSVHR